MVRFEKVYMYRILASAATVGAISLLLIVKLRLQRNGLPIQIKEKAYQKGTIIGGLIFGLGWAVTGYSPLSGRSPAPAFMPFYTLGSRTEIIEFDHT